jgi:hypothetical protein
VVSEEVEASMALAVVSMAAVNRAFKVLKAVLDLLTDRTITVEVITGSP